MSRIRVLDLAKELGIDTKTAIIKLQELGIQVKNHFNAISETEAAKLKSYHRSGKTPEKESAQKAGNKLIIRRKTESAGEGEAAASLATDSFSPAHEEASISAVDHMEREEIAPSPRSTHIEKMDTEQDVVPSFVASRSETTKESSVREEHHKGDSSSHIQASSAALNQTTLADKDISPQPQAPIMQSRQTNETSTKVTTPAQPPRQQDSAVIVRREPPTTSSSSATVVQRSYGQNNQGNQRPGGSGYQGNNYRDNRAPYGNSQGGRPQSGRPPYNNDNRGGYQQNDRGGYQQNDRGGYQQNDRGGYQQNDRGGYQQNDRGGYQQNDRGGYQQNDRPGYQQNDRGGYQQEGGRPPYRPQGAGGGAPYQGARGPGAPRFGGPSGDYAPRPGGASSGPKPFVMPEASAANSKDVPSRLKDRDKEREKRRVTEEEEARKNTKFKGRHIDDEELFEDGEVSENSEEPVVRTLIPNRRRSSAPKKKDIRRAAQAIANPTKASKRVVRVDEFISVNDLAGEMSIKATAIIKSLMKLGMMASINQQLDFETSSIIAQEFGFEVQSSSVSIADILHKKTNAKAEENAEQRPPIITIMGHVDHGKTSLLDAIRSANVAAKEAGGITQHIGAYQITHNGRKLTFLDTPGHEAFTSMRSRGAQVTDIVVLVVAADDGVMPQTVEAISHAKAANVPIIVAINKIDKPGSNLDRIQRELADNGVLPEEWGGDSIFAQVSAKTRQGLPELIDFITLQADVLELKARKSGLASGVIIEAKLDKSRGPVATVIVTQGTLKQGDWIVAGRTMGRVRAMTNDLGQRLESAEPATPVEIIGLEEVPTSGDQFNCVVNDAIAKEAVAYRIEKQRQKDLASQKGSSLEDFMAKMGEAEKKHKELSVIIKADTHGSVEAIKASLQKLDTEKVKTKILHAAVGGITETDVILAKASQAIIFGFNVRPDRMASQVAEQSGVKIECHSIIYQLIEATQAAMLGTLSPVKVDKVIGHAEVRNLFSVPKVGTIAGSMVLDGKFQRNAHIRVLRDNIVIYTGRCSSLKRFKDDAKEVMQGFECGIGIENYNDLKANDMLEAFIVEEIAATLN